MKTKSRFLLANLKSSTRETLAGYLFLMPNLLGFLIFTSLPVLASLALSFFEWDVITWPPKFVGLQNFVGLIWFHTKEGKLIANDPAFWKYTWNTIFLMAAIPVSMMSSLILAMVMNQKLKGIVLFRTIYFLPSICTGVAICLLWQWIYNPEFGLINSLIVKSGKIVNLPLNGPNWLSSTSWAKPALMIMTFWAAVGGRNMILYLASLQGVPRELYEAADIDGANSWDKFWIITFPLISPTTFFIFIMSVIQGFQAGFMQAYIMTRGGPAGTTTTISYYIYNNAYEYLRMGYASTISWLLFIVILLVTFSNWRYGGKVVHYT